MKFDLPGNWTYAGCLREPATGKMFSNKIIWVGNNSALACMKQCAAFGYPASGVEVSEKPYLSIYHKISEPTLVFYLFFYSVWSRMLCVSIVLISNLPRAQYQRLLDCGDITDVAANKGVFGAESECGTPCPGNPLYLCGDGNRLNTYYWNGTMNNWKTPKNTGFYEVNFHSIFAVYSFFLMRTLLVPW
jgi:hypothetical protein